MSGEGPIKRDEQSEEELRTELDTARKELDAACARRNELRRRSVGTGAASDGTITLAEALQLHTDARARLSRALARFSDYAFGRRSNNTRRP
jgi:hypothetical protein